MSGDISGLRHWNPVWDQTRAESGGAYVYGDEEVMIATDFECANGTNIRPDGEGYALDLEPEPGDHAYSGMSYYFCFGVVNKRDGARRLPVRVRGGMRDKFAADQAHAVLRRGERWFQLAPERVRAVPDTEILELELDLPGAGEPDPVLFVSNFHWHPFSELKPYLDRIGQHPEARVSSIGTSVEGRELYRVEIGPDDPEVPHIVMTQTPQPSEMGTWTCRAVIDFLLSEAEEARSMRARHRFTLLPATNPDGTVRGLGVSHHLGRFPYFEGKVTAEEDPDALPEMAAVWNLLKEARPWLFIEWHSNNWHRRPGQMLLRFRPHLMEDSARRRLWEDFDERLMKLPDTHHGNWTSHDEGLYQDSLCFQSITRLGCISHMIKHHDKFPLDQSGRHAVMCVCEAVRAWEAHLGE